MPTLGDVSVLTIGTNSFDIKDATLTTVVNEIIEAIGINNENIAERINNLNDRSFDALIKISSQEETEIVSIQDGMYKLQYVTITSEGDEAVETLNNSAILIQKGTNQYLYKDGQLSTRTKENNSWAAWIIDTHPVTSVNGMTGNVVIDTGVISVNGQTGVVTIKENVKANWATTDATSDSFIINKPDITEIKELYYNATTGLLATTAYSLTFTDSLDGYDLVKCYFRPTNKNLSDSNVIPPVVLYIPLNSDSQLLSGEYSGSVTIPYVNNDNRYAAYRCLISSDKTQFRIVSQTSLYGTAGTDISNATHGIYCYKIEAIKTGNLIVDNTQSSGSSFVESDPVFLASPAYNISATDIINWNNKLDTAPVTSVNGMTGAVTIQGNIKSDWDAVSGSDAEILNKPDLSHFLTIETQSNWNETNTSSAAYIQNKPIIVNSVNGQTGAVVVDIPVTSVNGQTGAVVVDVPVTSVNGQTGAVNLTIPTVPTTSTSVVQNDNNPVSGGAVYNKIADLIGSAPAALDTLEEIAAALNNDEDLAGTLTTQISSKIPKVSSPTTDNFASFNSDGTIKDSGHSHSDYITSIKTVNNESLVGTGNVVIPGLPLVTSADNGKILMVVNGQWQLVYPSTLYSGSGIPNNANGNNGDLYTQTD